jgi:hypothetical protein
LLAQIVNVVFALNNRYYAMISHIPDQLWKTIGHPRHTPNRPGPAAVSVWATLPEILWLKPDNLK